MPGQREPFMLVDMPDVHGLIRHRIGASDEPHECPTSAWRSLRESEIDRRPTDETNERETS
jgi:hypothetical protein